MTNVTRRILDCCVSAGLLLFVVGSAGCEDDAEDVGYETAYAGDYTYPADVGYVGGFAGGGYYAAASSTVKATAVRGAVGQAIRDAALGSDICAGQVTVTPHDGALVCGESRSGVDIVFAGCELAAGGTLDGSVAVQLARSASNANCDSSTTIMIGYTSTISNLTYTTPAGGKVVIPSQTSTANVSYTFGQPPTSVTIMTNGEVQRVGNGGAMNSDRTFTGTHTLSSISNNSYTLDGEVTVTDQSGGTATLTGTGLTRDAGCCRPTGGTLTVLRTGGSQPGSHTWTFTPTCGSATLDGETVMLSDCM
jgi:hypothetical protein